jgi:uncharacterized membrane protein YvbJ
MRVCSGCTTEYNEDFKFCPECGKGFNMAGQTQTAALNQGLQQLAQGGEQRGEPRTAATQRPRRSRHHRRRTAWAPTF